MLRPLFTALSAQATVSATQAPKDNEELARLYREDQGDRTSQDGKPLDGAFVIPRDKARLARAKELYTQNRLQTGGDYYHAAMILQHGDESEDYLLAHELCVVSIARGENRAKWPGVMPLCYMTS